MDPQPSTQAEPATAAPNPPQVAEAPSRTAEPQTGLTEVPPTEPASLARRIIIAAPLFPVAVGLIAGIVVDHYVPLSPATYWIAFVLVPLTLIPRRIRRSIGVVALLVAGTAAGAMLHLSVARVIPPGSIEHYVQPPGRLVRIYGTIRSAPQIFRRSDDRFGPWSFHPDRTAFLLDCRSVEGVHGVLPVTGGLRISVRAPMPDLKAGQGVAVFGRIYPLQPPDNPGAFDWAHYSRRQGIFGALTANHRENLALLSAESPTPTGLLDRARITAHELLTSDLPTDATEEAGLLDAMILGHRSRIDHALNEAFVQAGCAHYLAVSGIHVVIVMTLVQFLCWPFMLHPRTRTWIMLLAVVAFVLVAEPRPSILRAGIIAALYCIACLLRRQRAHLNWISAAAILILLVQPTSLFDVGWQLSFVAVLGVSYLTPAMTTAVKSLNAQARRALSPDVLEKEEIERLSMDGSISPAWRMLLSTMKSVGRTLYIAFFVSVAAWLVVLPIIILHFHRIQFWAAISSFLLYIPVSVVMALGFAKLLLGAVSVAAAQWVGHALTYTDGKLIDLVGVLGELPGASVIAATPPRWIYLTYYLFLATLACWAMQRRRYLDVARATRADALAAVTTPPRWWGRAVAATGFLLLAATTVWAWPTTEPLRVTVLDVGAGSATAIELPDGRALLYDVGSLTRPSVGRSVVVPFLEYRGIRRLDRVFLSHANIDHFNGLLDVIDEIPTGPIVTNPYFRVHSPPGSASRFLLNKLAERNHPVATIDAATPPIQLDGVTLELLWPPAPTEVDTTAQHLAPNDASTVIRLSYAGRSILLTGDIEEQAERALLQRGGLEADVLILPHHGGVQLASKDFIDAVNPRCVIRSSNEPIARTNNGLQYVVGNRRLYNTADDGAVTIRIDRTARNLSVATTIKRR